MKPVGPPPTMMTSSNNRSCKKVHSLPPLTHGRIVLAVMPESRPPSTWNEIRAWRKGQREALIARRMARDPAERRRLSEPIIASLRFAIDVARYPVLGVYWPIRGEIDLRQFARDHVEAGGTVVLPVVVEDAAPVEFWRWRPGLALKRGYWNIPVPPQRDRVT